MPLSPRAVSLTIATTCFLLTWPAHAQVPSPIGLWTTVDETTKEPKALIRIVSVNGQLQGSIDKLILKSGATRRRAAPSAKARCTTRRLSA
ncbi:hypothetical protein [Pigmentiphaga litoralis]|uniref:DUF2147 domain-containing protein n=1 Tax=Pigmentiphaga litoralis TaxID=516702 RepID=A0A7Y9IW90_9BURK|nr:hypothetical protein [Pigmentiphaga litoralis]NYE22149.1 hypothetical protein [Pigmentiphaga litoralis]NYE84236.1 hypothetical protein [Pigmentiphaga litoralis]